MKTEAEILQKILELEEYNKGYLYPEVISKVWALRWVLQDSVEAVAE